MKKWYAVHVMIGGEASFCRDLMSMVNKNGYQDFIEKAIVPVRKSGPADEVGEKVFPGYVLLHAELNEEVISHITRVPRFYRFAGGVPPVPLTQKEVDLIFENSSKYIKKTGHKVVPGFEVRIVGGPFAGFSGMVEHVDAERQKIKITVSIFGRSTPLLVDFDQVEG